MKLRTAVKEYKLHVKLTRSVKSSKKVGGILDVFAKTLPPGIDLAKVRPTHITKAIHYWSEQGNHVNSIIVKIKLVSGFWKWCIDSEFTDSYPIRKIHRLKPIETAPHNVISHAEFERLLGSMDKMYEAGNVGVKQWGFFVARGRVLVTLGYKYGLRRGEILKLKRRDVDYEKLQLFIEGKGGKQALIPFRGEDKGILDELDALAEGYGSRWLICTTTGLQYTEGSMHRWWKKALKVAGLPDYYRFHDLRHSFATRFIRKNINIAVLQKLMRHSSVQTTMRYVHLDNASLRDAIDEVYGEDNGTNNNK